MYPSGFLADARRARWYRCKGCGEPCAVGPNFMAHAKPQALAGIPDSVPCPLYNRFSHNEAEFMEHVAGEPLPTPDIPSEGN